MVTTYVEDYDGKREKDAVDPTPAEVPASPVEDNAVEAKVVAAPSKPDAKKASAKVETA